MDNSIEAIVRKLDAIEDITRLKAKYCRLVDTKKWAEWRELFTEDADVDLRWAISAEFTHFPFGEKVEYEDYYKETAHLVGREKLFEWLDSRTYIVINSSHHVHNPEIEILSENTARAIWALEDSLFFKDAFPVKVMTGFGYYHENYEKVNDEWLIKSTRVSRVRVEIVK